MTICVVEGIRFLSASCVKNRISNIMKEREIRRKETSIKVIELTIGTRRGIINKREYKSHKKHDKTAKKLRIQYIMK